MKKTIKCASCNSEWTVDEKIFSMISNCPFCGAIIAKEEKVYTSVSQGLQAIFALYGKEILAESKRFYSLLTDYIPEKERELKVLKMACAESVFVPFATVQKGQVEIEKNKAIKRLVDDCMLAESWAQQAIDWVIEALGYSVVNETAAEVKEVVKPQNPIPQPVVLTQPEDKQKTPPQSVNPQKQGVAISCDINEFVIKGTTLVKYVGKSANIEIPSSVTMIEKGAFSGCKNLESIVIPNSVTTIRTGTMYNEKPFYNCKSLKQIVLGNGITTISEYMFQDLPIEEIKIPSSVKMIEKGAFSGCKNLESIVIPNSVTTIRTGTMYNERPFYNCKSLKQIVLGNGITTISEYMFQDLLIEEIKIPSSVKTIEKGAFSGCNKLCKVVIPDSVTTIRPGTMYNEKPFYNCKSLKQIVLKGYNSAILENIKNKLIEVEEAYAGLITIQKIEEW